MIYGIFNQDPKDFYDDVITMLCLFFTILLTNWFYDVIMANLFPFLMFSYTMSTANALNFAWQS